jgi:hypothetical protein
MNKSFNVIIDRAELKRNVYFKISKIYPYFIVTYGTQSYKSKESVDAYNPIWKQSFNFSLDNNDTNLIITIYNNQETVRHF